MAQVQFKILLAGMGAAERNALIHYIEREKIPCDCVAAESLNRARELLEACSFDVIISEPVLSGGTVFDVIGLAQGLPVIVVAVATTRQPPCTQ